MKQEKKELILTRAKKQVQETCSLLAQTFQELGVSIQKRKEDYKNMVSGDKLIFSRLLSHDESRLDELDHLKDSPYFVKCRIKKEGSEKEEEWFFGKFGYKESSIFSWIAPAASIRFEKPGKFSYTQPDGKVIHGVLSSKEQYMIVHGKILFLATESLEEERELIYQEHFSTHKTGFVLPEIVAQMEKAQDQVIRADHQGSFVISGPAGSGKTTLALHRIAYLVQSPETTEQFPAGSIIVFVQDTSTQDYFSHLLPELGIKHVQIITFAQWALDILGYDDVEYVDRFGEYEAERDAFEQAKLRVLQSTSDSLPSLTKNPFTFLTKVYSESFEGEQLEQFKLQTKSRRLDRFDLTLLLRAFQAKNGALSRSKEYYQELMNGTLKKRIGRLPVTYSLILVDEFQNYLPEQITLMKTCGQAQTQSMLYVGDIAQQVQIGTVRDWSQIQETISSDRLVKLTKVYRNTKEILSFIRSLGYGVEIPEEIKTGTPVQEVSFMEKSEEIAYIKKLASSLTENQTIGVLARNETYLSEFQTAFLETKSVHVLDIKEAQGVEFDIVCLVGVDAHTFIDLDEMPEKQRILKNLLYIALTRAMSELHILGKTKLNPFS